MKTLMALVLTMLTCHPALASPTQVTNPYLPYPPGCGRMPDIDAPGGLESQAAKFYQREVQFYDAHAGIQVPMTLRAFRAQCSEPNRSLIWLEFILSAQHSNQNLEIQLPTVAAETAPYWRKPLSLTVEPNGWGSGGWVDREATYLTNQLQGLVWNDGPPGGERRWIFLLDNAPPFRDEFSGFGLTPTEYNAAFKLVLRYNPYDFLTIDVPATRSLLPAPEPRMPLSGRLSGNWVIPGTTDQGLMLSISERVLPGIPGPGIDRRSEMPMVIFLAHYTFDAHGDLLWLTGAAEFRLGALKVTIPVEKVSDGEFRGDKAAEREVVGQVTLQSFSCNDLRFAFEYSALGLGSGTRPLQRLFSLETAGYDCRDYEAKIDANR